MLIRQAVSKVDCLSLEPIKNLKRSVYLPLSYFINE